MSIQTVTVAGMTCGHCVSSVKGELSKLDGVSDVDVKLRSGEVTITSDTDLDAEAIKAAVDEAGYEVVS